MDFKLDYRWLEPPRNTKNPVAYTWAEFSIYIGAECITRHEDFMAKSVGDRVYIPLYYLAEWIASNWWNLVYQPLNPENSTARYYYEHKVKYARSGFSLPDLIIQPQGSKIFLQWYAASLQYHRCRFLNSGFTSVDASQLREELQVFVEAVIKRLEANDIFDSELQAEWQLVRDTSNDEQEMDFCIAAAEAGLDPYDCTEENASLIIEAYETIPSSVYREFLYASNPRYIRSGIKGIQSITQTVMEDTTDNQYILRIRNSITNKYNYTTPWMEGYDAARDLRERLGLNGTIINNIEDLNNYLKEDIPKIKYFEKSSLSPSIKLFTGININQNPVFLLPNKDSYTKNNPFYEAGKKFIIARGLYEYFYGQDLSLVSNIDVESQKRNRAFAAEFLLPASFLRKKIKSEYVSEEQVNELAEEFNISARVIEHQIVNNQIAEIGYY